MNPDTSNTTRWIFLILSAIIISIGFSPVLKETIINEEEKYWESCSYFWEHRSYIFSPIDIKRIERQNSDHPSPFSPVSGGSDYNIGREF